MKSAFFVTLALVLFGAAGCAKNDSVPVISSPSSSSASAIRFYASPNPPRPYVVVGFVRESASDEASLFQKLRESGASLGADALIAFRVEADPAGIDGTATAVTWQ